MKFKQIYYQIYYRIFHRKSIVTKEIICSPTSLYFIESISTQSFNKNENSFTFLNKKKVFAKSIDWDFSEFGKLWAYNINYFDFLNQKDLPKADGLLLIQQYINNKNTLKNGLEPYPISLRGINWIKFLSSNSISDNSINVILFNHYNILYNRVEYHLLGNHLLENGFSLLIGAYYFKDLKFLKLARKILNSELKEQICIDGAHFELSPMYHQILIVRLLDCINVVKNNHWDRFTDLELLVGYASRMLGWLEQITYKNGQIPMVNDSTYGVSPSSKEIFEYANRLNINWTASKLGDSGYRKWIGKKFEIFMDIGDIGPKYIPGHAHADTFNFEYYFNDMPFIVDTGISTYEKNENRQFERSTISHNTVVIGNKNSSNVWGGFRVAERAKIIHVNENDDFIQAEHNGYFNKKIIHQRTFIKQQEQIIIKDILNQVTNYNAVAYLHFHPTVIINRIEGNELFFNNNIVIQFDGDLKCIDLFDYNFCLGFNKIKHSIGVKIVFDKSLKTSINI
jgi:hypothetical protein